MSNIGFIRAASALLARASLAVQAGLTFGGKRNVDEALGYTNNITLEQYDNRYKRNGVARKVVNILPKATWRGATLDLVENDDPKNPTPFENEWKELSKRLKISTVFKRADCVAGLGNYSVILIGAPGPAETPLPSPLKAEDISFLSIYKQKDAGIESYISDVEDVRYGLPAYYNLKKSITIDNSTVKTRQLGRTHWSRIIHISDGLLDDELMGTPRLECVWNFLDDYDKVRGGGAESFWMTAQPGTQFDLDKDAKLTPEAQEDMEAEIDEWHHALRRVVQTKGVKMTQTQASAIDFKGPCDTILTAIASSIDVPQRIFLGSERGELASSQDRAQWVETIQDRRNEFAEPYVVNQLVDRLIEHKALTEPKEYSVRWPEIFDISMTERLDMADKMASINQKNGDIVMTPEEIRDRALGWDPLDEADLDELLDRRQAEIEAVTVAEPPAPGAEEEAAVA